MPAPNAPYTLTAPSCRAASTTALHAAPPAAEPDGLAVPALPPASRGAQADSSTAPAHHEMLLRNSRRLGFRAAATPDSAGTRLIVPLPPRLAKYQASGAH